MNTGHDGEHICELGQWFRRRRYLKGFLHLTLVATLLSGVKHFGHFDSRHYGELLVDFVCLDALRPKSTALLVEIIVDSASRLSPILTVPM